MKENIKYLGNMIACAVGWLAGCWVWENVLEDKVDDFKEKLDDKRRGKA